MPESTRANICLDADGLSRTFLQEIRRLWTPPPHPLRAACSAPSKTVSGLHGSIGLLSRLQPLQVAPVRPREVVLTWWFEHLAGRSRHGPHRPSFPGFVVTGSSGLEMTHVYRNGRRRTGGLPGLSALSPLSTGTFSKIHRIAADVLLQRPFTRSSTMSNFPDRRIL